MEIQHATWIDPRIEVRASPTHGRGAFACEDLRTGDVVTVWAHSILRSDEAAEVEDGELHERADGSYVWLPDSGVDLAGYDVAEEHLNHSCDPNVWMADEVTLVARRTIEAGEELTGDYALWLLDPD